MKCKHERIMIEKKSTYVETHTRTEDGGEWAHAGDFTGSSKMYVDCPDCGLKATYTQRRPKWLLKYLSEI